MKPSFTNLVLIRSSSSSSRRSKTLVSSKSGWQSLTNLSLLPFLRVSTQFGLTKLESEINGERTGAIDSVFAVGFNELVRLPNCIREMKAASHDYVLMGMNLVASYDNLAAGGGD